MPTGFVSNPIGLDDDDSPIADPSAEGQSGADIPVQVAIGSDNPYFDFRAHADPGGVGYYRLHTQYQLVDSKSTCLSLGLQAATPAGLDNDGVAGGPTRLHPSLACYHELEGGVAFQGFIGKSLSSGAGWTDSLERGLQCGVAVQRPLPTFAGVSSKNLYMYVEALGRMNSAGDLGHYGESPFELLPGLHWRLGDNWWLSGGLIVPVERHRVDPDLWQFTWSWRF
jgi:hypothetical protein